MQRVKVIFKGKNKGYTFIHYLLKPIRFTLAIEGTLLYEFKVTLTILSKITARRCKPHEVRAGLTLVVSFHMLTNRHIVRGGS